MHRAARSLRLAVLCLAMQAGAQPVVPPAAVDPGRLRELYDQPLAPAAAPRLPEMRGAAGAELPAEVRAMRVTLRAIRILGATVYTPGQLRAQTDAYLGREIGGADIFALAQALTARYRNDGYFLSLVIVPPQRLADGTLTLRVIEGYIASVRVEGDAGSHERLLALAQKIMASRPLQAQVLERYLLLAGDLPGLEVRSVLAPSQAPGAADLTLVASHRRYEGLLAYDNHASRYLGPQQTTLGLNVNRLLGSGDQLRYIGVGSGDIRMSYHQLSWSQVLDEEGWKLGLSVSQARTRPGDILAPFDIRGRADGVVVSLAYPLVRSRNRSLHARLAYESTDIRTRILGTPTVEDQIRALRAGLNWQQLDAYDGQNSLDVELSQGIGGTAADDLLKSRLGADGRFSKLTLAYGRAQPLGGAWSYALGVAGQWTGHEPLLSSEQFALGGRHYGRAYEPAELVGDRGLALRLEPRYQGSSTAPGLRSWQLLGFYEVGQVWRVGLPLAATPQRESLASAGLGARLQLAGDASALFEAAWPLTRPVASDPEHGRSVRLYGSLVLRF